MFKCFLLALTGVNYELLLEEYRYWKLRRYLNKKYR